MLQLAARPGCLVTAGVSGSGKTTFDLRYLVARRDFTCRFLFQEPKRDFTERLGLPDAETPEELECAIEDGWVIFHPARMFPGDWPAALEWFSKWSYDKAATMPGRKVLKIDELWRYSSPQRLPMGVRQWINDGRSFGCETVFATSELNRLPETITNGATEIVSFLLRGRNSLQRAEDLGLDAETVRALPPGAFVARNQETGGELRGRLW